MIFLRSNENLFLMTCFNSAISRGWLPGFMREELSMIRKNLLIIFNEKPYQSFYNKIYFLLFCVALEDTICLEGVGKFVKLYINKIWYILIFLIVYVLLTLHGSFRSVQTRFCHLLEFFPYLSLLESKMIRIGALKLQLKSYIWTILLGHLVKGLVLRVYEIIVVWKHLPFVSHKAFLLGLWSRNLMYGSLGWYTLNW